MKIPTQPLVLPTGIGIVRKLRKIKPLLVVGLLLTTPHSVLADDPEWEYRVVILQGVTAGGTIEKGTDGMYVDTLRTSALNSLALNDWEVVAVLGAVATDHTVYLRRKITKGRR